MNSARRPLTIFLDDGGVMNDNALRGQQWPPLVAEFLCPRLGGEPERWAEANRVIFDRMWSRLLKRWRERPREGYLASWNEELARWLREMCEHVGVRAPAGGECLDLARETDTSVTRLVRAAYPGVTDAIRELHARGHVLGTASGGWSEELEGYLEGMGVRPLFMPRLYGPDFIDLPKGAPGFYERLFADAAVAPAEALVVDDSSDVLDQAAGAGAATVLVSARHADGAHPTISSLAELPSHLDRWEDVGGGT